MAHKQRHTRRHPRSDPRGVLGVRAGGFGFVQTAEGTFFIPKTKMAGAFDGDLVEVAPLPGGKGRPSCAQKGLLSDNQPAARIVRVVERTHDTLVGRYEVAEPFGVVVPEDPRIPYDIFTMRADSPDIPDGSVVRVRITTFPGRTTAATGVVEEVVGATDDEHLGVDLIVARHKLETEFSAAALDQARTAALDEEGALASGYRDIRARYTLTIDPSDARDFDDALSLDAVEVIDEGEGDAPASGDARFAGVRVVDRRGIKAAAWRLGVHIADVSHYVPWNSSLDLDARRRATSVYLVDRVIPMLPEELSGDLCSLRPGQVRRTMTVDLFLDGQGRLVAYELYTALITSNARLSYDEAQALLDAAGDDASRSNCHANRDDGGPALAACHEQSAMDGGCSRLGRGSEHTGLRKMVRCGHVGREVDTGDSLVGRLRALSLLASRRAAARQMAGGLDFDTAEAKVQLDGQGYPIGIEVRRKTDATSLIEEAMILANETVARHLCDMKFPGIFRVHDKPSAESLSALMPIFQEFTWFHDVDQARFVAGDPLVVARVLAAAEGRAEHELVSTLVLRAMKRAVYKQDCEPHYGLAIRNYTHFTSPIRRYPDLVIHRMLKAQVTRRPEKFGQEVAALPWIAEHSSSMERVAEKAARESQELKIIEYMEAARGQTFSAVVSGVAPYGVYVRLENTAEGLVPLKNLGREYFSLDPHLHRLVGQDTDVAYRLGQRIAVVLTTADARSGRLDFRLA